MSILDSREALIKIMKRLPAFLQREFVATLGGHPGNLQRLSTFLSKKTQANNHPLLTALVKPASAAQPVTGRRGISQRAYTTHVNNDGKATDGKVLQDGKKDGLPPCPACAGDHGPIRCKKFLALSTKEKWRCIQRSRRCFNCLMTGHSARECRKATMCQSACRTNGKHNKVLHLAAQVDGANDVDNVAEESREGGSDAEDESDSVQRVDVNHTKKSDPATDVFMGVVAICVSNPDDGKEVSCYGMLDPCANVSVVSEELAGILGLNVRTSGGVEVVHTVAGATKIRRRSGTIRVAPFNDPGKKTTIQDAAIMKCQHFSANRCPTKEDVERWQVLQGVVPTEVVEIPRVMVLISMQHPELQRPQKVIRLEDGKDSPYVVETELGLVLYGGEQVRAAKRVTVNFTRTWNQDQEVQSWLVPNDAERVYDNTKVPSVCEQRAYKKMADEMMIRDERYEIPLPFRESSVRMPNNRDQAARCLEAMRRKFLQNRDYFEEYAGAVRKYVTDGHAVQVPEEELEKGDGEVFYLLHHGVRHPKKRKLRVVFNLSKEYQGKSLNGEVDGCPDLLEKIVGVLMRFRQERIAVVGDIQAFFHAVNVPKKHADFMRFLWFRDGDPHGQLVEYRMKVQVFGGTASQAAAVMALQDCILRQKGKRWTGPQVDKAIRSFYSDDFCASWDQSGGAKKMVQEVCEVLGERGFKLRGFASNDADVMRYLHQKHDVQEFNTDGVGVLGLQWDPKMDVISHQFSRTRPAKERYTKRECLSTVMGLYDPLGLLVPLVLPFKLVLHDLMIGGRDWDEQIDDPEHEEVERCIRNLQKASELKIPRCYRTRDGAVKRQEMHVFADGSSSSYGCAVYIRTVQENGQSEVALVCAKKPFMPDNSATYNPED